MDSERLRDISSYLLYVISNFVDRRQSLYFEKAISFVLIYMCALEFIILIVSKLPKELN